MTHCGGEKKEEKNHFLRFQGPGSADVSIGYVRTADGDCGWEGEKGNVHLLQPP